MDLIVREIFPKITAHMDQPEITLITGSRQVGKTVLMRQLEAYLTQEKSVQASQIISFNLDLTKDAAAFEDQTDFIEFLEEKTLSGKKVYVFVDEAQKVPEASRFFKGVYDSGLNCKLILSGSSSLEIKAKFKESLAGRKRIFPLMPFSFTEFLRSKDSELLILSQKKKRLSTISQKQMDKFYKDYLVFGGYPRVVLAKGKTEKKAILQEIYSSYLQKDILSFLPVKNPTAFNKLIQILAAQMGQLVNINELAMHLGVDRQTVENYLFFLEETFILKTVKPYFSNPRQEIIKARKVYFLDNGIAHFALDKLENFDQRLDQGAVLENGVFIELIRRCLQTGKKLNFWRTKQGVEVDFIVQKGQRLEPFEVKVKIRPGQIPSGLRAFVKRFKPEHAFVVNLNTFKEKKSVDQTKIVYLKPYQISINPS